jgi:PDDEXK-like domain of unknown function (DUF3799)
VTATTVEAPVQLPLEGFAPGVHQIPADVYHAQRVSLSSSGARKLLPPSCPAKFRYELDNPPPPKKTFDIGTAAHRLVLGDGPDLVVVDAKRWDSDAVKAEVAAVRAEGAIPLKRGEYEAVVAMATVLRQHPLASALFDPERGKPEQSLFWQDRATGVQCRARLDWLPETDGGRLLVADYKSAANASTAAFHQAVKDYRYDQQDEWYTTGVEAVGLAEDVVMVFVVQEKTPPYLINVCQCSPMWLLMAEDRNKRAREVFKRCTETGKWPGYGPDVEMVSPPTWLETEHERDYR